MPTYIAVCCYQCKMFQGQQVVIGIDVAILGE